MTRSASRRRAIGAALAVLGALVAIEPVSAAEEDLPPLLAGSAPLEVSVSRSAALFHWVDSLAGTSHGKTTALHQRQFEERFGRPDAKDLDALRRFRAIRERHAGPPSGGRPARGPSAMLGAFLEAPDLDAATAALRPELGEVDTEGLRTCLGHFAERHRDVWREGLVPQEFLAKARASSGRADLAKLLGAMARFFDVDPAEPPRPRLVLMPVPHGGGTHAEAVGRNLLVEIRPLEALADEAPPIVHEYAHFLWNRIPAERRARLSGRAQEIPAGPAGLALLREALPTALGQGVAGRAFLGKRWSSSAPWYHADDVDAYAKVLYPIVQAAVDSGMRLDETLLARMLRAQPAPPPARGDRPVSPR